MRTALVLLALIFVCPWPVNAQYNSNETIEQMYERMNREQDEYKRRERQELERQRLERSRDRQRQQEEESRRLDNLRQQAEYRAYTSNWERCFSSIPLSADTEWRVQIGACDQALTYSSVSTSDRTKLTQQRSYLVYQWEQKQSGIREEQQRRRDAEENARLKLPKAWSPRSETSGNEFANSWVALVLGVCFVAFCSWSSAGLSRPASGERPNFIRQASVQSVASFVSTLFLSWLGVVNEVHLLAFPLLGGLSIVFLWSKHA